MKLFSIYEDSEDSTLVANVLDGNRDCFSALVLRHQSAVCGVAYSICGDFKLSEDIAQESFVAAWSRLRELRETARFRAWVCGIARQLALSQVRRRDRRGAHVSSDSTAERASSEADPGEQAVSKEESTLLWNALERLPETYREPLVLFYREQESVSSVASSLELSEDAVKQRLSRGRALLREEVARQLEHVLVRTRPGASFALAVVGALPPVLGAAGIVASAGTAKAVTGGTGAGVSASGAGFSLTLTMASTVLSAAVGLLWFYLGVRLLTVPGTPPSYRRIFRNIALGSAALAGSLGGFITWVAMTHGTSLTTWGIPVATALIAAVVLATAGSLVLCIRSVRTLHKVRREMLAQIKGTRWPAAAFPGCVRRYTSPLRFLGLPLVSVAFGRDPVADTGGGVARGWIAFGDFAWGGLFAMGGTAMAPIAAGGLAVGLVSFGGVAMGGIAFGGLALACVSFGSLAFASHLALGGLAMAWNGAVGGLAVGGSWALGGSAFAPHANDALSYGLFRASSTVRYVLAYSPYGGLLSLLGVPGLIVMARKLRTSRRTGAPSGQ